MKDGKYEILYVDDSNVNLLLFEESFNQNYYIHTALSGVLGLEILAKNDIEIVVSDQMMPGMTGIEFLKIVNRNYPNKIKFLLTAINDFDNLKAAINEVGIAKFISKPWDRSAIETLFNEALEKFELVRQNEKLLTELQQNNKVLIDTQSKLEEEIRTKNDLLVKLEDNDKKFVDLTSNIIDWMWELDIDNTIIYSTGNSKVILGYTHDEIIGSKYCSFFSGDNKDSYCNEFKEESASRKVFEGFEHWSKGKDDREVYFQTKASPIFDSSGMFSGYRGVDKDITKLKVIEDELKLSEESYRNLFSFSYDGIILINENGLIVDVNPQTLAIFNVSDSDMLNKPIDFYFKDIAESILNKIKELNSRDNFELTVANCEGNIIPIELKSNPVIYKRKAHKMIFLNDISTRKQTEETLEYERYLFNVFMSGVPDSIYFKDLQGRFIMVNTTMAKNLGLEQPEEAIGKSDSDFFTEDLCKKGLRDEQRIIKSGKSILREERESWPYKQDVWVSNIKLPLFSKDSNEIIGTFGVSRDIGDRKKMESELKELNELLEEKVLSRTEKLLETNKALISSKERYRDLAELLPQVVFEIDLNSKITYANRKFYQAGDINRFDSENLELFSLILPDDLVSFKVNLEMVAEDTKQERYEFNILGADDKYYPALVYLSAIKKYGALKGYRGIIIDISTQKKLEYELKEAIIKAAQASKTKSEFLANMSHEIRTPLNSVLGFADLLSRLVDNSLQKSYVDSIRTSGKNLLLIINDILDLSKIESGKLEMHNTFVDTFSVFSDINVMFIEKAKEKGLELRIDIRSNTPRSIYIDELRIRQVLINLINNALKFTDKGYVSLSIDALNKRSEDTKSGKENFADFIIEVKDTGIGISEEFQERIFESFTQQDGQSTKKYGGTGLGLSISRQLVKLMNGEITLTSKVGKGSVFTISIPDIMVSDDKVEYHDELSIDPSSIVFKHCLVLVVDDSETDRNYISSALKNFDLEVVEAENGIVALTILKNIIPDIIISDLRMPNMDGYTLLEKIKENERLSNIPVIAASASVMKESKDKVKESKFSGFLIKPFQFNDLILELLNHLPYTVQEISKSNIAVAGQESDDNTIQNIDELIKVINENLEPKWLELEEQQPIDKVELFSKLLIETGEIYNAKGIKKLGEEILNALNNFDIELMLKKIKNFRNEVEVIKNLKTL